MPTGDYTVAGLEKFVAIERKSFADFLGCVGQHRKRFEAEMHRLLAYPTRALVIEESYGAIESGAAFATYRGKITPKQATGLINGLVSFGIPVITERMMMAEFRAFEIMRHAYNRAVRRASVFKNHAKMEPPKWK